MPRSYFSPEVVECARHLFGQNKSVPEVTKLVNDKFKMTATNQQMSSLRSRLGLGPMQKKGIKRTRRSPRSTNGQDCHVTVKYPDGEMSQRVDKKTAMAVVQILTGI